MRVMGALYENVHDKRQSVMSDNSIFDTKVFHAFHLLRNHNGTCWRSILKAATVKVVVLLHFGFRFSVLLCEVFTESDYRLFKVAIL